MFRIIDQRTKTVVATRRTRSAARRKADALDLAYGAIRYYVEETKLPTFTDCYCAVCKRLRADGKDALHCVAV